MAEKNVAESVPYEEYDEQAAKGIFEALKEQYKILLEEVEGSRQRKGKLDGSCGMKREKI